MLDARCRRGGPGLRRRAGRRLPEGPKVGAVCRSSSSRLAPREGLGLVPLGQLRKPAWAGEARPAGIRCALLGARPGPARDPVAIPASPVPGVSGSWGLCTHEPTCFFTGLSLQCLRRTKHPSELQALLR